MCRCLAAENSAEKLVLPPRLQTMVGSLFGKTLRCYLPDIKNLREFVAKPPSGNVRLHCTMIRHDDDLVGGSATYVLYLEYLGGLVPILKGKRASKLKPEFVIYDPHAPPDFDASSKANAKANQLGSAHDISDTESKSSKKHKRRGSTSGGSLYWSSGGSLSSGASSDSEYDDSISLPSPLMRRRCVTFFTVLL